MALGWELAEVTELGVACPRRKLVLGHKLYSGGPELVGADPLPWGPATRRLGAGGEGWWGLVVRGQPPGCATVCFSFLRPQNLPAVEHSRNTSQKSTGAALLLRWAWERLAGEGACVGF